VSASIWIDGGSRSCQRLGNNLASEQTLAPRVLRRDANEGVWSMRLEFKQIVEDDVVDFRGGIPRLAHRSIIAHNHQSPAFPATLFCKSGRLGPWAQLKQ
jgi:hypothetical protein